MPPELNTETICAIVTDTLKVTNKKDALSGDITAASRMGDPKEWDSLSFVAVFTAIGTAFDVELEDDDAIHFQSITAIEAFLKDIMDE
ncbi:MAG: acyl carrier protein [Akkermansiaceae bacterium]|jgi:acyl carrier protein